MITIEIYEEFSTDEDLIMCMEEIVRQLKQGYTSGQGWDTSGEEETTEED